MKENQNDFERFITDRFLGFFNKRESTKFMIVEKKDEIERSVSTYDFRCRDEKSNQEMAIEIKRLFSPKHTHLKNIVNWIHKYVESRLEGHLKGNYFLLIKGFDSPFKLKKKERLNLLRNIRNEIQALQDPGEHYRLECCDGISLMRFSKEGSRIIAWPVDFSHADDKEIVRILDASLRKFESEEMVNIILLVEHSSSGRGSDIVSIIEDLEHGHEPDKFDAKKRNFEPISEIYYLGLYRDTVISQVYPKGKHFESGFFNPTDFMEINNFRQWTNKHLL